MHPPNKRKSLENSLSVLNAYNAPPRFEPLCNEMSECVKYVIKAGEKEIEIDERVVSVLNKYVRTEMGLDKLAEELGLDSYLEAYEFVKKIPAWIMWVPSILWRKEMLKCANTSRIRIIKI